MSDNPVPTRDTLAEMFLAQVPYSLYPMQEDALLAWFSSDQGVMVCAPTGTGKTLIAEAAIFEALHSQKKAYYTTPLIALTDQKFRELQDCAQRWGFSRDEIGLVTGNFRINPDARILVVVAEILFNRLLHPEHFSFQDVHAVVMDEFHNFNDLDRGIVWEFTLGLLPSHIRTLLLSATVGNAVQFANWLEHSNQRKLDLVVSDTRKIPLIFQWVGDQLLQEHLQWMCLGSDEDRSSPALVFCFNRDMCWSVAEEIKGKELIPADVRAQLLLEINKHDWSQGAGPRLKQLLMRGVGIHHAGILPKYRRIIEDLFQKKLLAVATCTETLAAGINLPARSVVLPSIMKGPPGKMTIIESGAAHQIFGRAGRPQYDTRGHVFVLAHEDDVRILRWQEKFNKIPADTRDPALLAEKKALKKKQPKRSPTIQYWNEAQFNKLKNASPEDLLSRGHLPWRLLAYMLQASPEVETVRKLSGKRLMFGRRQIDAQKELTRMLATLWYDGYISLDPEPPEDFYPHKPGSVDLPPWCKETSGSELPTDMNNAGKKESRNDSFLEGLFTEENTSHSPQPVSGLLGSAPESPELLSPVPESPGTSPENPPQVHPSGRGLFSLPGDHQIKTPDGLNEKNDQEAEVPTYTPLLAHPLPKLDDFTLLRGINPLYGLFLMRYLGPASREERIQTLESLLELPSSLGHAIRVPSQNEMPPGPLAKNYLDTRLLQLGLAVPEELIELTQDEQRERIRQMEEPIYAISLAEKIRRLFLFEYPWVHVNITPCWVAGEILNFNGNFYKYITSKSLQKQEGMIFRHLLRFILLIGEIILLKPDGCDKNDWIAEWTEIRNILTGTCQTVDPLSTEKMLTDHNSETHFMET